MTTAAEGLLRRARAAARLLRGWHRARRTEAIHPGRVRLVSLDLFETLLLRNALFGDQARAATARQAARLACRCGADPIRMPDPIQLRRQIERDLGERLRERGGDTDIHHAVALRHLLHRLKGRDPTSDEVDSLCRYELEQDFLATRVNPDMVALVAQAREAGVRVIATSDMYLSGAELKELLDRHGVVGIGKIYSSCDHGVSKFSGRLFEAVIAAEGVPAEEILHVGDNRLADVYSASACGLHVRHVPRALPARTTRRIDGSEAYRFGHDVLGPVLATFAHLLLLEADRRGVGRLAFLARDGYLLHQATERLAGHVRTLHRPSLCYVHLSRRSTALAAAGGLDEAVVRDTLAAPATGGAVARVLAAHNVDAALVAAHLDRLGIAPQHSGIDDVARLRQDAGFTATLAEEAARQRRLLRRYLEQQGLWSEDVALVDIGWRGTIVSALNTCFAADRANGWRGIFLGLWHDGILDAPREVTSKAGLLSDLRRGRTMVESAAWHAAALLEAVCRAPEGTVFGYLEDDQGRVTPVLAGASRSRDAEQDGEGVRDEAARGALDYCETYGRERAWAGLDERAARREAQRRLLRLAFFPSAADLALARQLCHTEASAEAWHAHLVPHAAPSALRSPRAWLAGLRSPWRAGYVAASGGPLLSFLYFAAEATLLQVPTGFRRWLRNAALKLAARRSR